MSDSNLLEIQNLKMHFPIRRGFLQRVSGHVRAVDDVTLTIQRGETLGLVGESGCGGSGTKANCYPGRRVFGNVTRAPTLVPPWRAQVYARCFSRRVQSRCFIASQWAT